MAARLVRAFSLADKRPQDLQAEAVAGRTGVAAHIFSFGGVAAAARGCRSCGGADHARPGGWVHGKVRSSRSPTIP